MCGRHPIRHAPAAARAMSARRARCCRARSEGVLRADRMSRPSAVSSGLFMVSGMLVEARQVRACQEAIQRFDAKRRRGILEQHFRAQLLLPLLSTFRSLPVYSCARSCRLRLKGLASPSVTVNNTRPSRAISVPCSVVMVVITLKLLNGLFAMCSVAPEWLEHVAAA